MRSSIVRDALERLGAPLARRALLTTLLAPLAAGLGALALGAWAARLGIVRTPGWVLAAWMAAIAGAVVAVGASRRHLAGARPRRLARTLEGSGRFRDGSLQLLLDQPARGASPPLVASAEARMARELDASGAEALAGEMAAARRTLARTGGLLLAGLALLALANPLHGRPASLWRPLTAIRLLSAPVRLTASAEAVDRGASVELVLAAPGQLEGTLWTRAPGEPWRPEPVTLDPDGTAVRTAGPLRGDLHAHFEAGGRSSDTVQVRVLLPVFLGSLQVTAEYPGYLRLDEEALPLGPDTLILPAGTRLRTEGTASGTLGEAAWVSGSERLPMAVSGDRFSGAFEPAADRTWQLETTTSAGGPLEGGDAVMILRLVPDLAPEVEIPSPGLDTLVAAADEIPVVVDARDDHGLSRVMLRTRRGGGAREVRDLDLPPDAPDRALLAGLVDLQGLEPGDTLWYDVVALDNSPMRQAGASREMVVVRPTREEMRELQRGSTADLQDQLDSLARRGRELERQTEDLSRLQARAEVGARPGEQALSFEESRRAEEVARTQEELLDDMERLRDELRELERAAAQAGISDSTFMSRLAEIRAELERAMSPELRQRLAELQEALRNLDAPRTREAMQRLAEQQQQMREALERSRELFERAALEQELGALGQEAQEVAAAQQEWAERMAAADSARAAAEERALATRADSLAAGMDRAAEQLDSERARTAMAETAESVREAAEIMRQAAQSAAAGQRQQAQRQGQQAQAQLSDASRQVGEQREQQQEEWREEVIRALDQALLETTRLTRRQLEVTEGFRRGTGAAALRADQAVVEDGVRQLLEQVMTAGGQNALVPPRIAGALAAARQEMALAREAVSSATLNLREGAERAGEAVDALHVAAFMLVRARADVAGSSSGTGMAEAMERMSQLAEQQGSIGEDASGLMSMMNMPAFDQQLVELASRQRQLSRELDRLRAETDAGGAEEFAEEARELARQLEAGRLDPETVARQERLFRRMLDAGRTLQGEEEDEQRERQGRTAEGVDPAIPPALRDRLGGAQGRLRMPTWEELQRLSPEERRLVADYFRRLGWGVP